MVASGKEQTQGGESQQSMAGRKPEGVSLVAGDREETWEEDWRLVAGRKSNGGRGKLNG